ncbi:hypothetical protein [Streptomyces sp. CA-106110]|uniref:hypothetical protein n=1 Tax=Streptomyces sp. CA-106110 TaxID=3240044 RepID=UPI003D9426F8
MSGPLVTELSPPDLPSTETPFASYRVRLKPVTPTNDVTSRVSTALRGNVLAGTDVVSSEAEFTTGAAVSGI